MPVEIVAAVIEGAVILIGILFAERLTRQRDHESVLRTGVDAVQQAVLEYNAAVEAENLRQVGLASERVRAAVDLVHAANRQTPTRWPRRRGEVDRSSRWFRIFEAAWDIRYAIQQGDHDVAHSEPLRPIPIAEVSKLRRAAARG